jgi:hypothetical protein
LLGEHWALSLSLSVSSKDSKQHKEKFVRLILMLGVGSKKNGAKFERMLAPYVWNEHTACLTGHFARRVLTRTVQTNKIRCDIVPD